MPILGTIMPNMGIQKKSESTKQIVKSPKVTALKRPVAAGKPGVAKVGTKPPLMAREAGAAYRSSAPRAPSSPGSLADALFTTTQQRVLGLIFGLPDPRRVDFEGVFPGGTVFVEATSPDYNWEGVTKVRHQEPLLDIIAAVR